MPNGIGLIALLLLQACVLEPYVPPPLKADAGDIIWIAVGIGEVEDAGIE